MELISIIVPVYKVEKYLCECVDSILAQTYENFELILVDDGSPDNSGKICDKYAEKDKRIKVIHKENAGVSSARNTGLDNANGEYITFIDSDDIVDKKYLELMQQKLAETNSDMCFCHFDRFDEMGPKENKEYIPEYLEVDFQKPEFVNFASAFFNLKKNVFGSSCRVLYRSTAINVRFNTSLIFCEDLVFILNVLLNASSFCSIDNVLYHYRTNMSSALNNYKKNFLSNQLALKKEITLVLNNFDGKQTAEVIRPYFALQCYYLFSNEIKFRKSNFDYKENLRKIRNSELYQYFKLFSARKILKFKSKIKYAIIYFIVKTKILG